MASKSTDSQDLKLGPGWTSLSKTTSQHLPSTQNNSSSSTQPTSAGTAPRIAYTKAELLELYEPGSTASIPSNMSEYSGLTSSEPLVPVNIAPDDHISHVSALADTNEPPPSRNRFQANAAPRPGTEAILGREHSQVSSSQVATSDAAAVPAAGIVKKGGHVSTSNRDFWPGSAVLAAAERPNASGPPPERRPLALKPRSTFTIDRAASPTGQGSEKPSSASQTYWNRGAPRGTADSNSNWRGGLASGGGKYPGSAPDDQGGSNTSSVAPGSQNAPPRKPGGEVSGSSHFGQPGGSRPFHREGGLFGRNNKEALKPTNTRDLSSLTKGSHREPGASSATSFRDREQRDGVHHSGIDSPPAKPQEVADEDQIIWYYRDPQGNTQGPFASAQLILWEKEGYYDAELPVSKSTEHGFKPLAIAFGLRKEEPPVAAPPPGFNNSSPTKKDAAENVRTPLQSTREERPSRENRTTADLAEEVERMRLEARNQRNALKHEKEGAAHKERSFFDADDSPESNLNGHVLDEPLEQKPGELEALAEQGSGGDPDQGETSELPRSSGMDTSEVPSVDAPVKQSRFAAFMKQSVPTSEPESGRSHGNVVRNEESAISIVTQSAQATSTSAALPTLPDLATFEEEALRGERSNVTTPAAETSGAWASVMMGLQQRQTSQHPSQQISSKQSITQMHISQQQNSSGTSMTPMAPTTSEQDLMAIDPAIAAASFAQPGLGASPASSPRASSSEASSWLPFTGGMDAVNTLGQAETLVHVNQSLQSHPGLAGTLATHHPSQDQVQLQAQARAARVEADARARAAEAYRQAQMRVQAQQRQFQAQVQQAQAARVAAQHATALARAQAQTQTQPQDPQWMYKQRLSQLQVQYDSHYRAHVELTRTTRAAEVAINSSPAGSHDYQRARTVLAQAAVALKDHTFQMEQIRAAANTTHNQLVQYQTAMAREQQQRQAPVRGAIPIPDSQGNVSPHSIPNSQTHSQTHSPLENTANGSTPLAPVPAVHLTNSPKLPLNDLAPTALEFEEDSHHSPKKDHETSYDNQTQSTEGWEKVGRKSKPSASHAQDIEIDCVVSSMPADAPYEEEVSEGGRADHGSNRSAMNGALQTETEHSVPQIGENGAGMIVDSLNVSRTLHESAHVVAPWSKPSPSEVTSNGTSLREIQRQEELRSKAEEKEAVALLEKEEGLKPNATRWNHNSQPWGGAAGGGKHHTLSLREIEEEQKKKKAVNTPREPVLSVDPQVPVRPIAAKTGWASIAAKNSNIPQRNLSATTVVGKKMEDEASFWDSVSTSSSANNPTRTARSGYVRVTHSGAAQPMTNPTAARSPATKQTMAPAPSTFRGQGNAKIAKVDDHGGPPQEEPVAIGGRVSNEFASWFKENMQKITGDKSGDTMLCEYLVTIPSPSEIKDTILQNLGANDKTRTFADEFVRRLEFERTSVVADASAGGPGGKKKGRRHRAAKVDPSLVLGFTSTSSRIMQGTIETPEMK